MSKDIVHLTFFIMEFLILVLATFRITSLLVDEDGPFGLFSKRPCAVHHWLDRNTLHEVGFVGI